MNDIFATYYLKTWYGSHYFSIVWQSERRSKVHAVRLMIGRWCLYPV